MRRPPLMSVGLLVLAGVSTWMVTAQAAPSSPPATGVPIAQIRSFDTQFTQRMNSSIRTEFAQAAAGKTTWVHRKIFKDFIDETIRKTETANMTRVSLDDLQGLRCVVNARLDGILQKQTVNPDEVRDLLGAKLGQGFLAQRILPVPPSPPPVTVSLAGLHFPDVKDCNVAMAQYKATFANDVRLQNLCKAKNPVFKPVAIDKIDCVPGTPANGFNTGSVVSVEVRCQ